MSGTSKLVESGYRSFKSTGDSQTGIARMANMTGSNLISRYLFNQGSSYSGEGPPS